MDSPPKIMDDSQLIQLAINQGIMSTTNYVVQASNNALVTMTPWGMTGTEQSMTTWLDRYVKLSSSGPGNEKLFRGKRGKVFSQRGDEPPVRLGNVRDLKNGKIAASYRGPLTGAVVFHQEFPVVDPAILLVGLYHNLWLVRQACQVVSYVGTDTNLEAATEAIVKGISPLASLKMAKAKVSGLSWVSKTLEPYVHDLLWNATAIDAWLPGGTIATFYPQAAQVKLAAKFNEAEIKQSVIVPVKPEPKPIKPTFQVHLVSDELAFMKPYRRRQEKLLAGIESGEQSERQPSVTGSACATTVVTFNDGTKAVKKVTQKHANQDHEHVASLVGHALDPYRAHVVVPTVVRTAPDTVYLEYLDTEMSKIIKYEDGHGCDCCDVARRMATYDLVSRGAAIFTAAIDLVIANSDRHSENLMVSNDGRFCLIDHGYSLDLKKFNNSDQSNINSFRRELHDEVLEEWMGRLWFIMDEIRQATRVRDEDLAAQSMQRLETYRQLIG